MTIPASAPDTLVMYATAGVGTTPRGITSAPDEQIPAMRAASSISEDILVSFPIVINGRLFFPFERTAAAACPTLKASCASRSALAMPLIPSVPNNRPILPSPVFIKIKYQSFAVL